MITLYGIKHSRALRCLWMLEELGVPFEQVPTNFANGVADLNVAAVALWTKLGKVALTAAPNVSAWLDRCLGRPAFGRASKR